MAVFLCHNAADKGIVLGVDRYLRSQGIETWVDVMDLVPGDPYAPRILEAIRCSTVVVVFLGSSGRGKYQSLEIDRAVNSHQRMIPVLLPGGQRADDFLADKTELEIKSLDDEFGLRHLASAIQGVSLRQATGVLKPPPAASPYRPLRAFAVEDGPVFFGRKKDVEAALAKLRSPGRAERFLAVLGNSGSGKSSLARAGLVYSLQSSAEQWQPLVVDLNRDPLGALASALVRFHPDGKDSVNALTGMLKSDPLTLSRALLAQEKPVVILADQFEALFTQCKDKADVAAFVGNLLNACADPSGRRYAIITLRIDYLDRCGDEGLAALKSLVEERQIVLGRLGRANLEEILVEPAKQRGCQVDPALVEMLLADCESQANLLPLLQICMDDIWLSRGDSTRLTLPANTASGYLNRVLDKYAEDRVSGSNAVALEATRNLMLQLVTPAGTIQTVTPASADQDRQPARYVSQTVQLASATPEADAGTWFDTVQRLAEARLISLTYGEGSGVHVALSHEALIDGWKRLQEWLQGAEKLLAWRQGLDVQMAVHRRSGGDASTWLQEFSLKEACGFMAEWSAAINREEREFVDRSAAFAAGQQKKQIALAEAQRKKRLWTLATIAVGTLVLLAVGYYAWSGLQRRSARLQLLTTGRELVRQKSDLALVVAMHAAELQEGPEQFALLLEAIHAVTGPVVEAAAGTGFCLMPDGSSVAGADKQGKLEVWRVPLGTDARPTAIPSGDAVAVACGTGGVVAAVAGASGIQVTPGGGTSQELAAKPPFAAELLAIDASGAHVAAAKGASVWRWTGQQGVVLNSVNGDVRSLTFSQDGTRLAAISSDGKGYLWTGGETQPAPISLRRDPVGSIQFLSHSTMITGAGGPVGFQAAAGGGVEVPWPEQRASGAAAAESGNPVVTLAAGGTLSLWSRGSPRATWEIKLQARPERLLLDDAGHLAAVVDGNGAVRFYPLEWPALRSYAEHWLKGIPAAKLAGCDPLLGQATCRTYQEKAAH